MTKATQSPGLRRSEMFIFLEVRDVILLESVAYPIKSVEPGVELLGIAIDGEPQDPILSARGGHSKAARLLEPLFRLWLKNRHQKRLNP